MLNRTTRFLSFFLALTAMGGSAWAQPTWTLDPFGREKKPQKFEERKLGSERTADKKFTVVRNVVQNNVTHYNYYFNANNKVNEVIEKAKLGYKDDYSKLLSFYGYDLSSTASQKTELDSVIITSTAGILLHDLRNDWIDNMYLLIGKAYFLKKDFDSAAMTFQFINYNLFPRKKREEDNRVVGTNASAAPGNIISVANKEKRNILQKLTALPPSRNDALIWLIRTLIEMEEYSDAAGLINTLQNDPYLPKRLRNDLQEVDAYYFYKLGSYDSAAVHLEKALSNADNKVDKSRWEFLLAQLYEMNGRYDKASEYYIKAAKHTVDPMIDIYSRLNEAKMLREGADPKELSRTIDKLSQMGRRDKYEAYRDIIYYSAAQLSLQKPDTTAAINFYKKSLKYNESNIPYKNKAFLQLGDIAFKRKQYRQASAFYDSLQVSDTSIAERLAQIETRKNALTKIVEAITNIEREDSLQRIADMPPAEREDFLKKMLRKLRKEQGLKEEVVNSGGDGLNFNNNNQQADLFANSGGEWYFSSNSKKSKGFNEFKTKWGTRNNVDNWRRKSAFEAINAGNNNAPNPGDNKNGDTKSNTKDKKNNAAAQQTDLSYETLAGNLPLTPEKLAASNEILSNNLITLAKLYQNELEEYQLAADTYEDHLSRFPDRLADGDIFLGLYYCYTKLGDKERAELYKNSLLAKFPNSPSSQLIKNPASQNTKTKEAEATAVYDNIYTLFIEGDFEKAIAEKKKADITFGVNYWTPQLIYIEALYHVRQHNDSLAIHGLQTIVSNYPNSPLKEKAQTMIDVLKRRAEIETYLTNLQVTRDTEEKINVPIDSPVVIKKPAEVPVKTDPAKPEVKAPLTSGPFVMAPGSPHQVMMILDKVDGMYVNEAKNALDRYNRENYYGQPIQVNKENLDADRNLLLIASFPDAEAALQYYDKIRREARNELSWLPATKYSFLIITAQNLELLKGNKNIIGYKTLLNTQYPNRF